MRPQTRMHRLMREIVQRVRQLVRSQNIPFAKCCKVLVREIVKGALDQRRKISVRTIEETHQQYYNCTRLIGKRKNKNQMYWFDRQRVEQICFILKEYQFNFTSWQRLNSLQEIKRMDGFCMVFSTMSRILFLSAYTRFLVPRHENSPCVMYKYTYNLE